ncbi:hypothetical protein [Streptomyces sp. NPDC001980]|uniref:hypothetical protein n=1 Tax=Streptomyces sp. NPDC001980 TaxID=3157126 RepID=UPI003319A78A
MTTRPWARAIPPVTPLTALGTLGEQIATDNGQSSEVTRLTGAETGPDLLFKRYKTPLADTDAHRLDRLVAFGRSDTGAGRPAREVLLARTSWPVARVTGRADATIGCLIPLAPDAFRSPSGGFREIDTLALPDLRLARNGTPPTAEQRLTACRSLVGIAAALEQRRFVYSDWNYANAFWSPTDHSVHLIDIDGCGEETAPDIHQPGWEDHLARPEAAADLCTDRYRVALLTARCLTGVRSLPALLHTLADPSAGLPRDAAELLLDMVWAADRAARPRSSALLAALSGGPLVRFPVARAPLPPRPSVTRSVTAQPLQSVITRPPDRTTPTHPTTPAHPTTSTGRPVPPRPTRRPRQPQDDRTGAWIGLAVLFTVVVAALVVLALR